MQVVDQQSVKLHFVDFGNNEIVPLCKVKAISAHLLQLPAQAFQSSLSSIVPTGGKVWPDNVVERFSELTLHKRLLGKVLSKG